MNKEQTVSLYQWFFNKTKNRMFNETKTTSVLPVPIWISTPEDYLFRLFAGPAYLGKVRPCVLSPYYYSGKKYDLSNWIYCTGSVNSIWSKPYESSTEACIALENEIVKAGFCLPENSFAVNENKGCI